MADLKKGYEIEGDRIEQMRQSHTIGMQHGILHSDFLVGRF